LLIHRRVIWVRYNLVHPKRLSYPIQYQYLNHDRRLKQEPTVSHHRRLPNASMQKQSLEQSRGQL
jgi:hypothetical protein